MIKKIIHKLVGDCKKPIIDMSVPIELYSGYAGGSLVGINCLVVGKCNITDTVVGILNTEMANVIHVTTETIKNMDSIKKSAFDLIGPFERIFNVFEITMDDTVEQLQVIYSVLQAEVDYILDCGGGYTTNIVCTFVDQTGDKKNSVSEAIKNFITGLGEQLGRHNVLINGLFTDNELDSVVIAKWSCVLGSKYGYILAGDVIQLANI